MRSAKTIIWAAAAVVVLVQQIQSKEINSKKWLSKDKYLKKKASSKPTKEKKYHLKLLRKEDMTGDERKRICQSYQEDSVSDFFLKFGTVIKLIEDVSDYERSMKAAAASLGWRRKRLWAEKKDFGGDKYLAQSKDDSPRQKQIKHNHLNEKKKRKKVKRQRSSNTNNYGTESIQPCFGFNYLTAVDALVESDPDGHTPDIGSIQEFLLDLNDMKLSDSLFTLSDNCMDHALQGVDGCPVFPRAEPGADDEDDSMTDCPDQCLASSDCATNEICCPVRCGGNTCFNPTLTKYRSADVVSPAPKKTKLKRKKFDSARKCKVADKFMQCIYDRIKYEVCLDQSQN